MVGKAELPGTMEASSPLEVSCETSGSADDGALMGPVSVGCGVLIAGSDSDSAKSVGMAVNVGDEVTSLIVSTTLVEEVISRPTFELGAIVGRSLFVETGSCVSAGRLMDVEVLS